MNEGERSLGGALTFKLLFGTQPREEKGLQLTGSNVLWHALGLAWGSEQSRRTIGALGNAQLRLRGGMGTGPGPGSAGSGREGQGANA